MACAGLPVLAGCVVQVDSGGFTSRERVHFKLEGRPVIELSTFDGAIEVQSWDKAEVVVQVESRASSKDLLQSIDVDAKNQDSHVVVNVTAQERPGWDLSSGGVSRSARLIATVPADSELRVRSGDGSLRIERVRGRIEAHTDDGRIAIRDVAGEVVAETGDGSVQIEDLDGRCTVRTQDGSVLVTGRLRGSLKAESGDGSVTVRAADGSTIDDSWHIETGDGGVVLALPEQVDARLDVETNDGRISLNGMPDLPIEREGSSRRLQAVLGNGQGRLRVRTGDGTITLKRSGIPEPPQPPAPPPPPPAPPAPPTQ